MFKNSLRTMNYDVGLSDLVATHTNLKAITSTTKYPMKYHISRSFLKCWKANEQPNPKVVRSKRCYITSEYAFSALSD